MALTIILCVWPQGNNIFQKVVMCSSSYTFAKGMSEGFLLSEEEHLIPIFDQVTPT